MVSNLSFYSDDTLLKEWNDVALNKFNGLRKAEFINCDMNDEILTSILKQSNCMEELRLNRCDSLNGSWIQTLTLSNARARNTITKLDITHLPIIPVKIFHLFSDWHQLVEFCFTWSYELVVCPIHHQLCLALSCVLNQLTNLKYLSIRFSSFTPHGVPFDTLSFKQELALLNKNIHLTSFIVDDAAAVVSDVELELFSEAFPNVNELRLKDSIVASLPFIWRDNLNTLYWSTKAKIKGPFPVLPNAKHFYLDRRSFAHHRPSRETREMMGRDHEFKLALIETMAICNLESLSMTYFDEFPEITHLHSKLLAISLINISSLDFSSSSISNSQLAIVLSATKNLKSLSLFHCEEISGVGLSSLWETDNKLTLLNIGSTNIQLESIKKIIERSHLLETFKFTSYFKGVTEKKDTQKLFNEICLILSKCVYLHTLFLSENDYVNDNSLISLFTGTSPTSNANKPKATKSNKTYKTNNNNNNNNNNNTSSITPRISASPITKLYLFNIESVTDKFLKFLATDERTTILRYLDLAQSWKPTTKHLKELLHHCAMLSVQMSRQSIGKIPTLPLSQTHRFIISYKDLHQ